MLHFPRQMSRARADAPTSHTIATEATLAHASVITPSENSKQRTVTASFQKCHKKFTNRPKPTQLLNSSRTVKTILSKCSQCHREDNIPSPEGHPQPKYAHKVESAHAASNLQPHQPTTHRPNPRQPPYQLTASSAPSFETSTSNSTNRKKPTNRRSRIDLALPHPRPQPPHRQPQLPPTTRTQKTTFKSSSTPTQCAQFDPALRNTDPCTPSCRERQSSPPSPKTLPPTRTRPTRCVMTNNSNEPPRQHRRLPRPGHPQRSAQRKHSMQPQPLNRRSHPSEGPRPSQSSGPSAEVPLRSTRTTGSPPRRSARQSPRPALGRPSTAQAPPNAQRPRPFAPSTTSSPRRRQENNDPSAAASNRPNRDHHKPRPDAPRPAEGNGPRPILVDPWNLQQNNTDPAGLNRRRAIAIYQVLNMHKCKNTSHEAPRLRVAANLADELAASLAIRYNNHPNSDRTARRGRASTPQQNAGQPYSAPTPPQSSRTGELPNHEHPGPSQCTPRQDGISAAQPIQRT